jgi:RHS repeat-associated protein
VHGPDLNGKYGGLQGTGGLEAVYNGATGVTTSIMNDTYGSAQVSLTQSGSTWVGSFNAVTGSGYGTAPGGLAGVPMDGLRDLGSVIAWRGHYVDGTGYYYMGMRYYAQDTGEFLSADPLGHAACMDLYSYASGDPVNRLDPDGRWAGVDDAVAMGGGALVGLAGQGIADIIHGKVSPWQSYVASVIGGAAGGEATLYGGPVAGGLTMGATSNLARQGLNYATGVQQNFSVTSLVAETAVSGGLSYAGGVALPWAARNLLSNQVKGKIGESLSYAYNVLKGNTYMASQATLDTGIMGGNYSLVDHIFENPEGQILLIESKFGAAGLTFNQRLANKNLDNFVVEKWGYGFVGNVGGVAASIAEPVATQGFSASPVPVDGGKKVSVDPTGKYYK